MKNSWNFSRFCISTCTAIASIEVIFARIALFTISNNRLCLELNAHLLLVVSTTNFQWLPSVWLEMSPREKNFTLSWLFFDRFQANILNPF
jgi:hypothetical protein